MSANGSVQISDYSDREILMIMLDLGGDVTSPDVAARIYGWSGPDYEDGADRTHGHRCTSGRLVWMRRFGLVEKGSDKGEWRVTPAGKNMLSAELPKVVEVSLARASDTSGLALANRIGERLVRAGEISGTAMRRELQFQITRRKRSRA